MYLAVKGIILVNVLSRFFSKHAPHSSSIVKGTIPTNSLSRQGQNVGRKVLGFVFKSLRDEIYLMFRTYSINNVNSRITAPCKINNSLCHLCGSFESLCEIAITQSFAKKAQSRTYGTRRKSVCKWKFYTIGNLQHKECVVFYDIHYYKIIDLCETSVN